jgi:hypothetical protein
MQTVQANFATGLVSMVMDMVGLLDIAMLRPKSAETVLLKEQSNAMMETMMMETDVQASALLKMQTETEFPMI